MDHLYSILLKKNLTSTTNKVFDFRPDSNYTHWLSLGQFDDIYTYPLNGSVFLENIQASKKLVSKLNSEHVFCYSLYLVPDLGSSVFFTNTNQHWFVAIARIHFAKSINLTAQFKSVRNELYTRLSKTNLCYQIFYATEFSDMVLEARSDRLDELLKVVLLLREVSLDVGKVYTYFGINAELTRSSKNMPTLDDTIDMLSIKFSGYDINVVKKQLLLIKSILGQTPNVEASVNGVDDFMLLYKKIPTRNLINLYKKWFYDESYRDCRKMESLIEVGLDICTEKIHSDDYAVNELCQAPMCADLPGLCEQLNYTISSKNNHNDYGWFHAISEIANSLVRMSKTPIMDEIVYLLAPGVRSFLLNVLEQLNNEPQSYNAYKPYYYNYSESCSYFIEQLTRMEGQLSHHPEIRPAIYNIPVFMLEYIIAFLNKVSNLLQKDDAYNIELHTDFSLVPRPCQRISATEIFSARENMPGLVYLEIPENTLYNPPEIFRALCHEISHYVGEKHRSRGIRKKAYAHAVASLATNYFFNSANNDILKVLKRKFINLFQDYDEPTIREMHPIVESAVIEMFNNTDSMKCFISEYYEAALQSDSFPTPIIVPDNDQILIGRSQFSSHMKSLDVLFREVYADICMLCILDIGVDEYIESLLLEFASQDTSELITDEAFAIRIFVSLSAVGESISYNGSSCHTEWKKIEDIIRKIEYELVNDTDGENDFYIPSGAIYPLLVYAKMCYDSLNNSLSNKDKQNVVKMYSRLSGENFQYLAVLHEIEQCRADMIKKQKTNL